MELISLKAACDAILKEYDDYPYGERARGLNDAAGIILDEVPAIPAVPLEPLAKWIAENLDPRCGCSYCSRDRVCCDCPTMTEQQVKEELTKWMEEQDE